MITIGLPVIALNFFSHNALAGDSVAPPIVSGTETSDFEAVGSLMVCTDQGCMDFCSATLIHNTWAATAAHCVQALDEYVADYGYEPYFVTGAYVWDFDDYAQIIQWEQHPSYVGTTTDVDHDIGLVRLSGSLSGVTPMPINIDAVNMLWVDTELTYVGYGITGDGRTDSGYKRTVDMPVYTYDAKFIYSLDVEDGDNLCSGDSGGASLNEVSPNVYELAGVNSFVFPNADDGSMCNGGGSGATRVDMYIDWIEDYVDFSTVEEDGSSGSSGGSSSGSSKRGRK